MTTTGMWRSTRRAKLGRGTLDGAARLAVRVEQIAADRGRGRPSRRGRARSRAGTPRTGARAAPPRPAPGRHVGRQGARRPCAAAVACGLDSLPEVVWCGVDWFANSDSRRSCAVHRTEWLARPAERLLLVAVVEWPVIIFAPLPVRPSFRDLGRAPGGGARLLVPTPRHRQRSCPRPRDQARTGDRRYLS